MMTQHPDNASQYIPVQKEVEEALEGLLPPPEGMGLEEIMVDFEGKATPFHQTVQIAVELVERGVIPGKDVYITPRLPSATQESPFRQHMTLLSAAEAGYEVWKRSGVFGVNEVIVPMVRSVEELLKVRKRIEGVVSLLKEEFGMDISPDAFHLLPLIEDVRTQVTLGRFLEDYCQRCAETGLEMKQVRVMIGRSDPALCYGMLPAALSNKLAVMDALKFSRSSGVSADLVWGAGALPFRGHLTPDTLEDILREFGGVKTVTIQSGLRYDHSREEVSNMVARIKRELKETPPIDYSDSEREEMLALIGVCAKQYVRTLRKIVDIVSQVAKFIPRRRDRLTHLSHVGYGREFPILKELSEVISSPEIGRILEEEDAEVELKHPMPRVIAFAAACYTLGLPPEVIGTGRGLKDARDKFGEEIVDKVLERLYPLLRKNLEFAQKFLNFSVARRFLSEEAIKEVKEDLRALEELGVVSFEPPKDDRYHRMLRASSALIAYQLSANSREKFFTGGPLARLLSEMGRVRGSLG